MNKLICISFFLILLSGCDAAVVLKSVEKEYEVIEIKRPKYFKVTLKDKVTGETYSRLSVSKRCSSWNKLKIGDTLKFKEVTYRRANDVYKRVEGIKDLCKNLRNIK